MNAQEERGRDMVFGPDPRPRRSRRGFAERPRGAFGQEFPQTIASQPDSAAVAQHQVLPAGEHAEADRVDADGLPFVGAAVWPGQSYYTTVNTTNGAHVGRGLRHIHEPLSLPVISVLTIYTRCQSFGQDRLGMNVTSIPASCQNLLL